MTTKSYTNFVMSKPVGLLTYQVCAACGHRHHVFTKPTGIHYKDRCWLCGCKKHKEPRGQ